MAEVTVVTAPPLANVANVELMHTGTWRLASGPATFTVEDLLSAVAAQDCPAVRRPILKLGHTPDPAPGQPAIGFIAGMATAENGRTLVGDYVGLPGWLATQDAAGNSVLSSAYPDRSIEGQWDFRCQIGHTHPFVITAVALLGEEAPGIGTLQSLQDLADLYQVAAGTGPTGTAVTITIHASKEGRVPNPRAAQVAAGVTTEDVRRAYYATPAGAGWSTWIEEMQLEPLQLIVMDDDSGTRSRVPVQIGNGDGEGAVSFGDGVKVVIRYDDTPAAANASAGGDQVIRFASRDESRPPKLPAKQATRTKKTPTARARGRTKEGAGMDPAKMREALGLSADAPDDEVTAALVTAGLAAAPPADPPAPDDDEIDEPETAPVAAGRKRTSTSRKAAGTITIDASAWQEREDRIKRLEAQDTKRRREERDQVIANAVSEGKFPPARKEHWVRLWDADPEGTRQVLAGLARNVVPVSESGYAGDGDDGGLDDEFAHLFPPSYSKGA